MITAEDIIKSNRRSFVCVEKNCTLYDALKLMVEKQVGEITVTNKGNIVGIWSERDLMRDLLGEELNLRTETIGNHMMPIVYTAPHTATINELQTRFVGLYIRHLHIEKNGTIIGLVTSEDTIKAGFTLKTQELETLTTCVGLAYYENWKHPAIYG